VAILCNVSKGAGSHETCTAFTFLPNRSTGHTADCTLNNFSCKGNPSRYSYTDSWTYSCPILTETDLCTSPRTSLQRLSPSMRTDRLNRRSFETCRCETARNECNCEFAHATDPGVHLSHIYTAMIIGGGGGNLVKQT
jgi:hypothetical protein